jgi:hypothetical protein
VSAGYGGKALTGLKSHGGISSVSVIGVEENGKIGVKEGQCGECQKLQDLIGKKKEKQKSK